MNNRDWLIDTSFKEFAAGLGFILFFIMICIVSYKKVCFSIIMMALASYCAMFAGKK